MNTIEGIIKDVENGELVSDKVIKKVRELIGEEEWNDLNDEENDIITTTGELLITLKRIQYLEEQIEKMKFDAVKEAFRQGKVIQYNLDGEWVDWSEPTFDDEPCNYRIKEN